MDLATIIGEAEWSELAAGFRTKRECARPAGPADRFRGLWSEWELDAICRFTLLPESDTFRLITQGKQIPAATYRGRQGTALANAVQQFRKTGATVNFARVELFSNPALALCRSLEAALRVPARVHFFSTPPHAQGLGAHADHGDVLILQLEGEKAWDVYHGSDAWTPAEAPANLKKFPPESITLRAGGWLFLPAGVYHEVRNKGDASSTHFTIGFQPLSWGAALESALEPARRSFPELKETVDVMGAPPDTIEIERRLRLIGSQVARVLEAERYGCPVPASDLASREAIEQAGAATRFSWSVDSAAMQVRRDGIEISKPYRSVPLRLRPELAEPIRRMMERGRFSPAELRDDPTEALLLGKFLANVGVLKIEA